MTTNFITLKKKNSQNLEIRCVHRVRIKKKCQREWLEFIKEEKCEMKKLKEKARDERNKVGEYVRERFAYTYIHTYIYIYM